MTTTTDWPTGSSDHAASNVKTATIIQFDRHDFRRGTVERVEREIDTKAVLAGNALFQRLSRGAVEAPPLGHPWSGEDKA